MKILKKVLILFLAICLTFPCSLFANENNIFTDVKNGDWFYNGVMYTYENGLMNGVGNGKFAPYTNTTRSMLAAILWRIEEEPKATACADYTDIKPDQFYTEAVSWISEKGLMKGYGDGRFGPNDLLTREQLVTVFYRFAEYKNCDISFQKALNPFKDYKSVSSFATDAMSWATANGIINGASGKRLNPKSGASRAELATIIMRFIDFIENSIISKDLIVVDAINFEKDVIVADGLEGMWEPDGYIHSIRLPKINSSSASAKEFNNSVYNEFSNILKALKNDKEYAAIYNIDYEYKIYNGMLGIVINMHHMAQAGGGQSYYYTYYYDIDDDREIDFGEYLLYLDLDTYTIMNNLEKTPEYSEYFNFPMPEDTRYLLDGIFDENSSMVFISTNYSMMGWVSFKFDYLLK